MKLHVYRKRATKEVILQYLMFYENNNEPLSFYR